jgi:hypothetical protein
MWPLRVLVDEPPRGVADYQQVNLRGKEFPCGKCSGLPQLARQRAG